MAAKKKLHPTMQANADRLKRGEPLHVYSSLSPLLLVRFLRLDAFASSSC